MLVDNINFTFPAFPVLSGYRNEFRGAKVYYFSRILTCARLTFFLSTLRGSGLHVALCIMFNLI